MSHWSDPIARLDACKDAVNWLRTQPDAETAWRECQRGDWMLWLLSHLSGEPGSDARRRLVLCTCAVARLALPYVPEGEERPLKAIETAERWARGDDVSLDDVRYAARAARGAALGAASAASAAAFDAGAAASAAAYDAAYTAAADAYTAYAAARAAHTAVICAVIRASFAASAARSETLARAADIVRQHYPEPPEIGRARRA